MMKKVILICLLSLSSCLSRPEQLLQGVPPAATNSPTTNAKDQPSPSTPSKEAVAVAQHVEPPATPPVTSPAAVTPQSQPTINTTVITSPSVPVTTKTDADANKTTDKKEPPKQEATTESKPVLKTDTVIPPSPDKKEKTTIIPADSSAVPTDNGKKDETVTVKPDVTPKPTETPKATDIPLHQARGFDGPSFIGGIILTLGLLAIGFMGFKYYKNQTERNYHTL